MDKLTPLWEKILNQVKSMATQQLFRQQARLTKLDFNSEIAVVYFRFEKIARFGEARKDRIEQAIFDVLGVDFEVIITCNENDAYNNVNDELTEGDNLETITLDKLEQAKKNLLPNQFIIGRGWIDLLNSSKD